MRTLRTFLIIAGLFIGSISVSQELFASCDGWFAFTSCTTEPPICSDGKCTLGEGSKILPSILPELTNRTASQYIQDIVMYFMGFISIIAVLYIIYAGFQVMIGGGDEEKMKKAKNTILYVIVGIIIMWLAYSIVRWATTLVTSPNAYRIEQRILSLIVPETSAAPYTETSNDTFAEYKNKIRISLQEIEKELRVNNQVSSSTIQNLRNLVQAGFDRLPDTGDAGVANDTAKRAVDMYIDLAMKNPSSNNHVSNLVSKTSTFIDSAQISAISGDISASPGEGNAPLTVSFRANNIKDPSGATPDAMNYIWWMRTNGGQRRELGRGASLVYTFNQEGTFTVFLDVISGSRNSKGRIDVLPLSISKSIDVKPKLGEIVLMVNGVNVSNISSLKMSPALARMGIILDATASRAIGNGTITSTNWDFGNNNTINYKGPPIVERQIFTNQGNYQLKLELVTNDGQRFVKEFQLIIRDPAAVIETESTVGHVGEEMHMSALSYFTNNSNIEYTWQIQDENNKKVLKSSAGNKLDFTFNQIGKYIVTLTAKSPNGGIDSDSKTIQIESREPVVNLEMPAPINSEKPNTIVFNASKSYDADTKNKKGLIYTWRINGVQVELDNPSENGARGTYTFDTAGTNTVTLTVTNSYGKVTTVEKQFDVTSTLSADVIITPQVAPIGTPINFIAQSKDAVFYEWSFSDGGPSISGTKKIVQRTFQKSGIYDVTLTIRTADGNTSNQIRRKVYATDSKNPMAIIEIKNGSNTVYQDPNVCIGKNAWVINRSEPTNFEGSKSVNTDGTQNDLSYTWKYFSKVKTTATLSEKLSDLGCFPIELTVRNNKTGSSNTTTEYIYLKNQVPELTSLSTNIDATKKDTQKVLVRVVANGARDPDGVITSYIWYYTTESDKEPQNVQITQKGEITFVLPNITEKYYFGVILEDNDGGRANSGNNGTEQVPLILDNQNGNIYMPLISLGAPKTAVNVGEKVQFSVTAKTIVGTDITKQAEYSWDIDGDGKIDEKTNNPYFSYTYQKSGTYTVKVRATYNGVSNTKYQTIYVKNPLKASTIGYTYADSDKIYFLNTSQGNYTNTRWEIGSVLSENPYGMEVLKSEMGTGGILGKISIFNDESNESHNAPILSTNIETLSSSGRNIYQSFPKAENNAITLDEPSDKVLLSFYGHTGVTEYRIDQNTNIDSDLDGIADNDIDNSDTRSYTDGSVYVVEDFTDSESSTRSMKITLMNGSVPAETVDLSVRLSYIRDDSSVSGESVLSSYSGAISTFDRTQLDTLASHIRSMEDTDRIILMKAYNTLIENWADPFAKAKLLVDIQEDVNSMGLTEDKRSAISETIDALLMGDAQSTDEITLSAKLIDGLVPAESPNREMVISKLAEIQSHPQLLDKNRELAREILQAIEKDTTIEDKYKIHIKNQLLVILNGGQASVPAESIKENSGSSSGIFGFIGGIVKIFFIILGLIILVLLGAFGVFRLTRKENDQGFQDFVIDRIFHSGSSTSSEKTEIPTPVKTVAAEADTSSEVLIAPKSPESVDPFKQYVVNPDTTSDGSTTISATDTPITTDTVAVPDWLKAATTQQGTTSSDPLGTQAVTETLIPEQASQSGFENTLPQSEGTEISPSLPENESTSPESTPPEDIPDWLKPITSVPEAETTSRSEALPPGSPTDTIETQTVSEGGNLPEAVNEVAPTLIDDADGTLPDWLVDSIKTNEETPATIPSETIIGEDLTPATEGATEGTPTPKKKRTPKKKVNTETPSVTESADPTPEAAPSDLPDWLK